MSSPDPAGIGTSRAQKFDRRRLDFRLLQLAGVHRFATNESLDQASAELRRIGYDVFEFDARHWSSDEHVYDAFANVLSFPANGGRNLDALNDWLHDFTECGASEDSSAVGSVLILRDFDGFLLANRRTAEALVSILSESARFGPVLGHLILVLLGSSVILPDPRPSMSIEHDSSDFVS